MTSRTTAAKAKTPSLSLGLWVGAMAIELSQKIEGARDGNGPVGPRELERPVPRRKGIRDRLDMLEVRFGAGGEVPCPEGPRIRGLRGDQGRPEHRERLEHQFGPLVGEDRADEDVLAARSAGQEGAHARKVGRAVPARDRRLAPRLQARRA